MAEQKKCAHSECRCRETSRNGFCSDACAQGKMAGGKCGCGHPDCQSGH